MQAIVVTDQAAGTAGMKLVDRPEPQPSINDVVVQVHASGYVNTELDWPSTWTDRRDRDRTPSIPGHELAGVVTSLGDGMMNQPGYLPLVRMVIAETPRFPQLGALFFATVTRRGLSLIVGLLQTARERRLIADVDPEAVAHTLLGGLLTYAIMNLVLGGDEAQPIPPERADAVVEIIMRALTP